MMMMMMMTMVVVVDNNDDMLYVHLKKATHPIILRWIEHWLLCFGWEVAVS